ncbi:non-specific serine,threonine protein kinase [Sarracenia purpurea var. burkii]
MEEDRAVHLMKMIEVVNEISSISDFRCVVRRQCRDLSMRLKLLTPLFEELAENREDIFAETENALIFL